MNVAILGAKGQLGRDLVARFNERGNVRAYDLPELDIAARDEVRAALEAARADLVINAAAYTDVEAAEDDVEAAFRVNETGARYAAEAAADRGIPVVYYSTDYIFGGGRTTPYETDAAVAPQGVYAKSKAAGEQATREANPRHFIVRTAWLYGPGGNNFVEKILRLAAAHPTLKGVEDEGGSPTHTYDLAEATYALCATTAYGVYHAVNAGACSRLEWARAILRLAGMDTAVEPCRAADFPAKAPRPAYSVLSTTKLKDVTGYTMRPWYEALAHYMTRRETPQ